MLVFDSVAIVPRCVGCKRFVASFLASIRFLESVLRVPVSYQLFTCSEEFAALARVWTVSIMYNADVSSE